MHFKDFNSKKKKVLKISLTFWNLKHIIRNFKPWFAISLPMLERQNLLLNFQSLVSCFQSKVSTFQNLAPRL